MSMFVSMCVCACLCACVRERDKLCSWNMYIYTVLSYLNYFSQIRGWNERNRKRPREKNKERNKKKFPRKKSENSNKEKVPGRSEPTDGSFFLGFFKTLLARTHVPIPHSDAHGREWERVCVFVRVRVCVCVCVRERERVSKRLSHRSKQNKKRK